MELGVVIYDMTFKCTHNLRTGAYLSNQPESGSGIQSLEC